MNSEWFKDLLPVANLTGIPLLVGGILLLLKAYQGALDAHKESFRQVQETSKRLEEENGRLRTRLNERDSKISPFLDQLDEIAARSVKTIDELEARKLALMASPYQSSQNADVISDVRKINDAISILNSITSKLEMDRQMARDQLRDLKQQVAGIADQLTDTRSRALLIQVIVEKEIASGLLNSLESWPARALALPPSNAHGRLLPALSSRSDVEEEFTKPT